ncbi:MAG: hypothetical protein P9M07_05425 [Candidatus Aceula meridiana]|nr:hypothetical protein [Candidatus Aceula meridiana]
MKRIFIPSLLITVVFAAQVCFAGNPLDVFKGKASNANDPYGGLLRPSQTAVKDDGGGGESSEKVKIDGKKAFAEKSEVGRSSGDEKGSLHGLGSSQDDFSKGPGGARTLGYDSEEGEKNGQPFLGTWLRTATYVDGALAGQTPATLNLRAKDYDSSGTCYTSGSLSSEDDAITLVMLQSSCPGGVKPPLTITYTYTISEDNTAMTIFTGPVLETYIRQK